MEKILALLFVLLMYSSAAQADIVILRDGKSYSGEYTGDHSGKIAFTDASGIQYTFPLDQVQSLVLSNVADHIALRNGQSYSGHWTGVTRVSFRGVNGVGYVFPLHDVSSLVISHRNPSDAAAYQQNGSAQPPSSTGPANPGYGQTPQQNNSQTAQSGYGQPSQMGNVPPAPANTPMQQSMVSGTPSLVIPSGSQMVVRTDASIDTAKEQPGQLYPATITQDVVDSTGAVGIPAGTQASLKVVDINQNSGSNNPNLALSLNSIQLNGVNYYVDSSSVDEKATAGFGMNKRTAEMTGGGAAVGTVLGALFGGGRGAGVGMLAGGGLGGITQFLTRGKRVNIPAESTLTFQLENTLILHP